MAAEESARMAASRVQENARRQAELLTRSADALERSAALVDEYAKLSTTLVRTHADIHARAERARRAAHRSRALTESLR
jgi:hypothetical protein